jgi:hypothetical protein
VSAPILFPLVFLGGGELSHEKTCRVTGFDGCGQLPIIFLFFDFPVTRFRHYLVYFVALTL